MTQANPAITAQADQHEAQTTRLERFVWAGIVAPLLFFAIFTLDGALMPHYSAYNEAISYLEVGGFGWIQRLNFLSLGVLLAGFSFGYAERLRSVLGAGWVNIIRVFLILSALGWIIAGSFAPNPYLAPQLDTFPAYMHQISFIAVFLPYAIGCILTGVASLRAKGWRAYGLYSLINGLILLVPPIGSLSYLIDQSFIGDPNSPGGGLFNRIALVVFFVWYILTALLLLRMKARSRVTGQVKQVA